MSEIFSKGIEELRNKLINTSRRNKLINYKKPSKTRNLKIIDESAEFIFHYLVKDESKFRFGSIPEPDIDSKKIEALKKKKEELQKKLNTQDEKQVLSESEKLDTFRTLEITESKLAELQRQALLTAEERAKELGYNISSELPDIDLSDADIDEKHTDDTLQTLHYPNEMEKVLKKIELNARSIIEETGSNMLYLVLGVLKWQEADHSDHENKSPLITIPVSLTKTKRNSRYDFTLEYSGEALETNRSLAEKLLFEFDLILPELTDEVSFSEYIEQVKSIISDKNKWSIKQEIALDFLHFGKILMYQDLKEENWDDGLIENPVLNDIFIGKDVQSDSTFAPEYDIDTNQIANKLPLVMDADSSQHSAIVDVIQDKNVVIEGPPGTGKSQTIANIIAALLAEGKSVLFVSEKLAALEVVYKRLESIGLSDFCLELHSHKSKKLQVLQSIQKRMDAHYPDIRVLNQTIQDIEHRKNQLSDYINIIHKRFGKIDQSIYNIFWTTELYNDGGKYLKFDIQNAKEYTHFKLNNVLDELDKFRQFHENYDYDSFFWKGLDLYKLDFIDIDDFLILLQQIKEKYIELQDHIGELPFLLDNEFDEVQRIYDFRGSLELSEHFNRSILNQLHDNTNEFYLYMDKFTKTKNLVEKLEGSLNEFIVFTEYNNKLLANLNNIEGIIKKLVLELNIPKNYDIEYIDSLLKSIELLDGVDEKQYLNLSEWFGTSDLEVIIVEGEAEFKKIVEYKNNIKTNSNIDSIDALEVDDIARIEGIVESKKNSLFNIFSGEYRKTLKEFQSLFNELLPKDKSEWTKILANLKVYIKSKNDYKNSTKYPLFLGNIFEGMDTNWNEIKILNNWAKELRSKAKNSELINVMLSPNTQKYSELLKVKSLLKEAVLELDQLSENLNNVYDRKFVQSLLRSRDDINVLDLIDKLEHYNNEMESLVSLIYKEFDVLSSDDFSKNTMNNMSKVDFEDLNYSIEKSDIEFNDFKRNYYLFEKQALELQKKVEEINHEYSLSIAISNNDYLMMQDTLSVYDTINNSNIFHNLKLMLFEDFESIKLFDKIHDTYIDLVTIEKKLHKYGTIRRIFYGDELLILSQCINKLDEASSHKNTLSIWSDFRKISHSIIDLGLESLVNQVESKQLPDNMIDRVFNFNFFNTLVKEIFRENPLLVNFSRLSHEQLVKTYRELDKKLIVQNRKKVAYLASKRTIPQGYRSNRKSELTELSLIENEVNKKKCHIPIRQLVRRASAALQGLKPCFMMSPLSVSQYLPTNEILFDVLIVDEASQLRPEEALGSIARAKQVVIVGDPKQLPPTSFFNSMEKSTEDETVASESESILDICLNLYKPIRQLRWHYRSQHEALIDFSNQQFYDGNLLVFPSPTGVNSEEFGIKHHYIENSIYHNRRNKVEAKIILEHLELQMKKYPDRSIGIGTFNSDQRDLIQDMLDEREKHSPIISRYVTEWQKTSEPFFIKNLENLQGDERDVIFISTTYGKDKDTGKVYQRFGPINTDVGWRRLNVMVTRSKQKMEIFTSLSSSDIIVSDTSSRGVRVLRAFLNYVETSTLTEGPEITGKGFDSEFEESVYKILNDVGYKTVPQVGVAGYFIDLAVVSEKNNHDFVLAIECDGATYHSSKSARDRDRLKQEVLERLGWTVYRIWSIDWYKNRENEISKLIEAVQKGQAEYQDYEVIDSSQDIIVHEVENINEDIDDEIIKEEEEHHHSDDVLEQPTCTQAYLSDEKVKEMLVELRDTKIANEFDIDKRCILSDLMIEQFIIHKPIDMDEFRDTIPLRYRNENVINIDQMKFMPDIFEILGLADE